MIAFLIPLLICIGGYLLRRFYFTRWLSCSSKKKLNGKIAIVTGANSGIGFETALDFACRGATVILACRDIAKAYKASSKILLASRNEKVYADKLDLADLESIENFAERFINRFDRLDILVNNAGGIYRTHQKTVDGFEMSFGTMHLGHFYLTNLLLDHLKKSAPSRIINVSSEAHRGIAINWDDIQSEHNYSPIFAYRQAKLANILFTVELERRLGDTNVWVASVNPGLVNSDIFQELKNNFSVKNSLFYLFLPVIWLFGKDCKQGAQTTVYCALTDHHKSGQYFSECQPIVCSKEANSEKNANRLWELSMEMLKGAKK